MSEQEQVTQLSALFDGELEAGQSEMVVRRAVRDPVMRGTWERYALIGACLRNEPFRPRGDAASVADRVRARLADEPPFLSGGLRGTAAAAVATARRYPLLGRGALGGAIAASVALASILVVRSVSLVGGDAASMVAANAVAPAVVPAPGLPVVGAAPEPAADAQESAPPSYTTPVDGVSGAMPQGMPLVNYVVAHSEVVPSAVRFSPMSSVMSASYDIAQGAIEMTAAEIGARR